MEQLKMLYQNIEIEVEMMKFIGHIRTQLNFFNTKDKLLEAYEIYLESGIIKNLNPNFVIKSLKSENKGIFSIYSRENRDDK
jgi:hypothetical protein